MPATPAHVSLQADTEARIVLDTNCGTVRIVVVANPAVIYFNAKDAPIPPVASDQTGNQAIPPVLAVADVQDETSGAVSVLSRVYPVALTIR